MATSEKLRWYLCRHAWAEDREDFQGADDNLRPLTSAGRKRYRQFLDKLAEFGRFHPQRLVSSPLLRARQTAELLAETWPQTIEEEPWLAPCAEEGLADRLWCALGPASPRCVEELALVGHSPDLEDLLGELLETNGLKIQFSKGAIACVAWEGANAADGKTRPPATLEWFITPRCLGIKKN